MLNFDKLTLMTGFVVQGHISLQSCMGYISATEHQTHFIYFFLPLFSVFFNWFCQWKSIRRAKQNINVSIGFVCACQNKMKQTGKKMNKQNKMFLLFCPYNKSQCGVQNKNQNKTNVQAKPNVPTSLSTNVNEKYKTKQNKEKKSSMQYANMQSIHECISIQVTVDHAEHQGEVGAWGVTKSSQCFGKSCILAEFCLYWYL